MCIRCSVNYIESGCSTCMYMYMCVCVSVLYMCVCVCLCLCLFVQTVPPDNCTHSYMARCLAATRAKVNCAKYHKRKPCELCIQIPTTHTVPTSVSMNIAAHAANLAMSV